ncbi:uncharacterized protein LOC128965526, partial [Oppia nitens]|uniref:uncharacterized protein LOC128965526 n=1 Tax=Oppia nitens TaxID=1686743 RepID=UPI0023D9D3B9
MDDNGYHQQYNQQHNHQNHYYPHQNHNHQNHLPPPHAYSMRSATDLSSNSTKITDYVTNHEIKFTKTEGCTPSTCVCLFMALLFVSIAATSGIYFSLRSYEGRSLKERVFKGQLTITNGEPYTRNFERSDSQEFKSTAEKVQLKLNQLFNNSHYAKAFSRSEIIALERKRDNRDDVVVHFNIHMSAQRPDIDEADLFLVLGEEILNSKLGVFKNWTIDYNSLDIQERRYSRDSPEASSALLANPWEYRTKFPGLLEGLPLAATPSPRKCTTISVNICNSLSYNKTSYPNIVGHWNTSSLEEDLISYRQIIDFECYPFAQEFICRLLQPECIDDELVYPCRDFCQDFYKSCSHWIPKKLLNNFDCNEFPVMNDTNNKSVDKTGKSDNNRIDINDNKPRCRPKHECISQPKVSTNTPL